MFTHSSFWFYQKYHEVEKIAQLFFLLTCSHTYLVFPSQFRHCLRIWMCLEHPWWLLGSLKQDWREIHGTALGSFQIWGLFLPRSWSNTSSVCFSAQIERATRAFKFSFIVAIFPRLSAGQSCSSQFRLGFCTQNQLLVASLPLCPLQSILMTERSQWTSGYSPVDTLQ